VTGGCINDGRLLATETGPRLFLKLNPSASPDMFLREAEGLAALAVVPGAPRVPAVLLHGPRFLLLEYLPSAPRAPDYWPELGRRLARLHAATRQRFGFDHDNYLGATAQRNPWTADGYAFFADCRLLFQGNRAYERGLLGVAGLRRVERFAARLSDLVPLQPASLIHGDLWSGNIIPGPDGHACLIDPAAHYGWAEAELAMTALFGRPPESFYTAYNAERPLAPGYQERFDLYNLYHLLNHLNLFGSSYLSSVEAVLGHYT
jgi:fructosamine-3-kinase